MRWQGRAESSNVEDRRGFRMPGGMMGGGAGLLIAIVAAVFFGIDPRAILQQAPPTQDQSAAPAAAGTDEAKEFVSVVLKDTEDAWTRVLAERGVRYPDPKLVLFSGAVDSACGMAQSAVGPFYCPKDREVYLDLSFFQDLSQRFGAPGDFAQAYVIAHEVGHHVQNVLGLLDKEQSAPGQDANATQVRVELQADCLAGVWGHYAEAQQDFLEWGDVDEAMDAASAIGDDRLQKEAQGYVVPESFTHGTSEQRRRWFKRGLDRGKVEACDTFSGAI